MFNRDHGSVVEKGNNPGNWEAARPLKLVACTQDLLLFSCELM